MTEKKRRCPYCGSQEKRLTKEHVISKSVLKVAFGQNIENVVRQPPVLGGRVLLDEEPQIRDVCGECNAALIPYDVAGVELMQAIYPHHNATGRSVPFSRDTLGWLLKTHLNEMCVTPNDNFVQPQAKPAIYRALRRHGPVSVGLYRLYIEGWEGEKVWWEKDSPKSIQYFAYKGVQDRETVIYISNFRIVWLDTFLFLPMNGNYRNFLSRCDETQQHLAETYGFNLQHVDTTNMQAKGTLDVATVAPRERLERSITRFVPIQQADRWPPA